MLRSLPLLAVIVLVAHLPAQDARPPSGPEAILPPGAVLEELWNEGEFTEGVAAGPDGVMYFSDIPGADQPGRILAFDPATGETRVHSTDSRKSNGLEFDEWGNLIAACGADGGARALCRIGGTGEVIPLVSEFEGRPFNSPNDLTIDAHGWIYFSDPRYVGEESVDLDHMSVYLCTPPARDGGDWTVRRVTTDISKPNGVILSPDGQTLYVAETDNGTHRIADLPAAGFAPRMTLNAFPVNEDGSLGERRVLVDYGTALGVDGMTVDDQGRIYAAVRSDGNFGIRIYSPEGDKLGEIPTPTLPTNCTFGVGDDAHTLYVTAGGGLYRVRLNARGAP
jgi:gluconolactonase